MRRVTILAAIVVAITLGAAKAASADSAAIHIQLPDEVVAELNPCTGNVVPITISHKKTVLHWDTDPKGGLHFSITDVGTFVTSDGFAGRYTVRKGSGGKGAGNAYVERFVFSGTGGDGTGRRLIFSEVAHLTVVNPEFDRDTGPLIGGDVVVDFDSPRFKCAGKPG